MLDNDSCVSFIVVCCLYHASPPESAQTARSLYHATLETCLLQMCKNVALVGHSGAMRQAIYSQTGCCVPL